MNNIAVKVENLSKVYKLYPSPKSRLKEALHPLRRKYHRDFYALKNVSFKAERGEVLGIIGKNGAGKSTLLEIICAVIQPTAGSIQVNGNISALLGLGSEFNPEFTGIENVYFHGSTMNFTRNEMEDKLEDILSFADIGDFINQPIKCYSSGMKTRLAFAVAINIDPEILIVDEVLAVGDELFRRKCYAKIEKFMEEGKTILFVTHSLATINELCTRAILIDRGELILEGPSKLVTTQYQRYLYARPENTLNIRNEIIKMNQDEELKRKLQKEVSNNRPQQKLEAGEKQNKKATEQSAGIIKQKPFYIPDFKPKTTVEYKNYDVEIYDIYIKTLSGEKVNILVMNDEYIFSYKVNFDIDAENVKVTMAFKTEKGLTLGWDKNESLKQVKKRSEYLIEWYFRCNLLQGNYY
jgi:lipopolysaccharide transport system ATP-binding protein